MIKIVKKLRYAQVNSGMVRRLLSLYYKDGKIYRIPFGPLRGLKMRYFHAVNFHAILGLWELENFSLLLRVFTKGRLLKDDMVFCDIGADLGVYSLWFSRLLSKKGIVYAFEPSPDIIDILRENILINNANNVTVLEAACADRTGDVDFFLGAHHHISSLQKDWASAGKNMIKQIKVKATTLDDFFYGKEKRDPPDLIKIDIEGGAVFALKGCDRCIKEKRPLILIESHMPEEDLAISRAMQLHDYQAFRLTNRQWVENIKDAFPNPRGVWGTLLLCPAEARENLEKILPRQICL